jgi:hypothetical protein
MVDSWVVDWVETKDWWGKLRVDWRVDWRVDGKGGHWVDYSARTGK